MCSYRDRHLVAAFWSPRRRARHNQLTADLVANGWREADALRLAHDRLIIEEMEGSSPTPDRRPDILITL